MRSLRIFAALALATAACGGGSDVSGTWNQPNGTIAVPPALGGGTVDSNNTLVFDDTVSPHAFTLTMDLSFMGLTDTLVAHGTYQDDGKSLAMTFTGFDAAQGDSASTMDGNQCITLAPLAGATVCFASPQTATYSVANGTLTIAIQNEIVGGDMAPTTLTLTRK